MFVTEDRLVELCAVFVTEDQMVELSTQDRWRWLFTLLSQKTGGWLVTRRELFKTKRVCYTKGLCGYRSRVDNDVGCVSHVVESGGALFGICSPLRVPGRPVFTPRFLAAFWGDPCSLRVSWLPFGETRVHSEISGCLLGRPVFTPRFLAAFWGDLCSLRDSWLPFGSKLPFTWPWDPTEEAPILQVPRRNQSNKNNKATNKNSPPAPSSFYVNLGSLCALLCSLWWFSL